MNLSICLFQCAFTGVKIFISLQTLYIGPVCYRIVKTVAQQQTKYVLYVFYIYSKWLNCKEGLSWHNVPSTGCAFRLWHFYATPHLCIFLSSICWVLRCCDGNNNSILTQNTLPCSVTRLSPSRIAPRSYSIMWTLFPLGRRVSTSAEDLRRSQDRVDDLRASLRRSQHGTFTRHIVMVVNAEIRLSSLLNYGSRTRGHLHACHGDLARVTA